MSTADKRVAELLDRWLASVELHARYLDLDDAAYAKVQDWPPHQRPTRWILELARARLQELQRLLAERRKLDDDGFAEALELMGFLTNLLGSEHVERFVPLALPPEEKDTPARIATAAPTTKAEPPPRAAPKAEAATSQRPAQPAPADVDRVSATVVADAVRLLNWGREWPQLAGLIARLADRPPEQEVWKILRRHRAAIESKAGRRLD